MTIVEPASATIDRDLEQTALRYAKSVAGIYIAASLDELAGV